MKTDREFDEKTSEPGSAKKRWQPMKLTNVGDAKDVVRAGSGKDSPNPADPGEVNKPPGQKA